MRAGYSWRTGSGRRMWISGPLWLWLLAWLVAIGPVMVWLALKALVWLIVAIVNIAHAAHRAPAVPPALRRPPGR